MSPNFGNIQLSVGKYKEIIKKHWNILSINSSFKETFNNIQPKAVFHKNKSLKKFIGTNTIKTTKNLSNLHQQQPQVNVPHVTPINDFAACLPACLPTCLRRVIFFRWSFKVKGTINVFSSVNTKLKTRLGMFLPLAFTS